MSDVWAYCARCGDGICVRHTVARDGQYICSKCDREAK
jgi:formylmethanofuran dehydrogenase subunit E